MKWVWTDERVAELRKLHAEGQSASKIAKIMGAPTRNTIIGKTNRLGLRHSAETIRANNNWENRMGVARKPKAPPIRRFTRPKPPKPGQQNKPALVHGLKLGTDFDTSEENIEAKRAQFRADGLSLIARVESGAGVVSLNPRPFRDSTGCKWPLAGGMVCCNRVAEGSYCRGHSDVAHGRTLREWTPSVVESMAAHLTRFDGIESVEPEPANDPVAEWDPEQAVA